tara:strand:+ start:155 stop:448 length:294 start_codon:yes stop_codon:yes gene_type:complete
MEINDTETFSEEVKAVILFAVSLRKDMELLANGDDLVFQEPNKPIHYLSSCGLQREFAREALKRANAILLLENSLQSMVATAAAEMLLDISAGKPFN